MDLPVQVSVLISYQTEGLVTRRVTRCQGEGSIKGRPVEDFRTVGVVVDTKTVLMCPSILLRSRGSRFSEYDTKTNILSGKMETDRIPVSVRSVVDPSEGVG